ncbi:MAG: sugar phosphate nucleotidyltransferase [Pseudomonadota bacterium]
MKAVILSAGRGSRLLPLTDDRPKCLLPAGDRTVLGRQLFTLAEAGVVDVTVVTGFLPKMVEAEIDAFNTELHGGAAHVKALYNPFYQIADNLASCWMAREAMREDFIILNGDTLFEPAVVERVLAGPASNDVQVTIDKGPSYDADDMKVTLDGDRLTAIGKTLLATATDAESIGMIRFTGAGPKRFTDRLEAMMRTPDGVKSWYLKAIDAMARDGEVIMTCSIEGLTWAELDTPEDFEVLTTLFGGA